MSRPLVAALVGVAVAGLFASTIGHYLVWTDEFQIGAQRMVATGVADLPMLWDPPQLRGENYWRPLQVLSNSIDWWIWGDRWSGYHATNVVLHASCSVLVFFLSAIVLERVRAQPSTAIAAMVAYFWAVNPLKSESVAWIADRCSLLAALFTLGTLLLALRQLSRVGGEPLRGIGRFSCVAPALLYLCALFSKESAIGTPLLLAITQWTCKLHVDRRRSLTVYGPLALVGVGYTIVRLGWFWHPRTFEAPVPLGTRLATQTVLTVDYLAAVLWPFRPLASDASALHPGIDFAVVASALALAGVLAVAIVLARRGHPLPLFALAWFAICLGPAANLFPQRHLRGDRYVYLASSGVLLGVASACAAALPRVPRAVAVAASLIALCVLSWATVRRNVEWRAVEHEPSAFFQLELERSPQFREALGHLCRIHAEQGEYPRALALCERGLALDPSEYPATAWQPSSFRAQLLDIYIRSGDCERGLPAARQALVQYPRMPEFRARLSALRQRCRPAGRADTF